MDRLIASWLWPSCSCSISRCRFSIVRINLIHTTVIFLPLRSCTSQLGILTRKSWLHIVTESSPAYIPSRPWFLIPQFLYNAVSFTHCAAPLIARQKPHCFLAIRMGIPVPSSPFPLDGLGGEWRPHLPSTLHVTPSGDRRNKLTHCAPDPFPCP